MFPDRFRGVAGLPQYMDEPLELRAIPELRRCVEELGFVGCLINPDPTEGLGDPPGLGRSVLAPAVPGDDRAGRARPDPLRRTAAARASPYTLKFINEESIAVVSLLGAKTFDAFPDPEDRGRSRRRRHPVPDGAFPLLDRSQGRAGELRRAVEEALLRHLQLQQGSDRAAVKVVGTDDVLFGTEKPGTGSARDPMTGRDYDDMKPVIESIEWLTRSRSEDIFECNCRRVYARAFRTDAEC